MSAYKPIRTLHLIEEVIFSYEENIETGLRPYLSPREYQWLWDALEYIRVRYPTDPSLTSERNTEKRVGLDLRIRKLLAEEPARRRKHSPIIVQEKNDLVFTADDYTDEEITQPYERVLMH
jgi:hypothetical protein